MSITSGPWRVEVGPIGRPVGGGCYWVTKVLRPGESWSTISVHHGGPPSVEPPSPHPDALLIAASPDLLAALESAVEQYGKPGGPWSVPDDPGGWLALARAALKKARGEM